MVETLLKYVSVYLGSMVKFIAGPIFGTAHQLSVVETAVFSILGMMTTVFIIMLIGGKSREWLIRKLGLERKFSTGSYRFRKMWEEYGVPGIAFLTPLLFTPIGGAILAVMLGGSRRKIVKYMFVSAIFWGFTISFLFDRLGTAVFGF
ncbi:MAG TPA: hypothetical protein VNJ07_06895 [Chitinophagales bacterium]|nr:hypothetical protein [Chitinophagales bacterium]